MTARISLVTYVPSEINSAEYTNIEELLAHIDPVQNNWITVRGIHDRPSLEKLLRFFEIDNPLLIDHMLDDSLFAFEGEYENCLYLEYAVPIYEREKAQPGDVRGSFILGKDFLILYEQNGEGVFVRTRKHILSGATKVQRHGLDYLLYLLLRAAVVDHYFHAFRHLNKELEDLEDEVLTQPGQSRMLQSILSLREKIKPLWEYIYELEDFLEFLVDVDSQFISEDVNRLFTKSLYREAEENLSAYERLRQRLKEILDLYMANININSSRVTQVLTVIATIFLPITFIASVYGMNFDYMPELSQPWGYPAVLLLMLTVALSILIYMRRKGWF
jgi:magnesium transporter